MLTVQDVMTRQVVRVTPTTPLKEVAALLVENRISGMPVVGDGGAVVGVVSEADFLMKELGAGAVHHRPLARLLGETQETRYQLVKLAATTAAGAMTRPAVVIGPHHRLSEAAALMTGRRVNRLPVVDRGRLVGIVTRGDLVRAYVRSDEELARTIKEEILRGVLWLDPVLFSVSVKAGLAAISGRVERRSTSEMIERSVAMLPGIVDVQCDLTWDLDDADLVPASRSPEFPYGVE
jgi:CBS domain-containing protein